ncbi:unnamed protein product [Protopolystoma xenopodis]|uniref:Uncharacterized protein n=1 Tax=Protopolystoma xenopodis TaxID=117903 RepID=A0A3S5AF03_9PLAT|nr:unnamed protein product [Protopolystoma xenopodis]
MVAGNPGESQTAGPATAASTQGIATTKLSLVEVKQGSGAATAQVAASSTSQEPRENEAGSGVFLKTTQQAPIRSALRAQGSQGLPMALSARESHESAQASKHENRVSRCKFLEKTPQPAGMIPVCLDGTGPWMPTQINLLLAATGGGIATNELTASVPLHTNDLEVLRQHLIILTHAYNIQMNVRAIRSSADEMELFSVINRKFRHIFNKQEEMRTFKAYDFARATYCPGHKFGLDSAQSSCCKSCLGMADGGNLFGMQGASDFIGELEPTHECLGQISSEFRVHDSSNLRVTGSFDT